ncbi:alpha/beta hydrolase family protein [Chitinophaga tropicalis]|uniref:Xaa-Pro dipeptidyl-peptidase-like domain-containing protein n=1 Tax=Chitinophaga tropicalis TaxID=2683588 RepID=A0A7K1U7Y4_9BACT|nr:CocE/NonD family hydrolase [Chitinophaga tropicalis]MVT10469.1 hypothetical protein [Chitinophaga tropicalis]
MLRQLITLCLFMAGIGTATAQDITGTWYGTFSTPQGQQQRLQLQFEKEDGVWTGEMLSPDITPEPIEIDTVILKGDSLKFTINRINFKYTGAWGIRYNGYMGYFEQVGNRAALNISRKEIKEEDVKTVRPQDPAPNQVYDVQDVKFVNKTDKVLLSGTFTKPAIKDVHPVIILISGAGQQNRDNEILGHKPFAVLADYLVKRGIATLRWDDRGVGESTGNYDSSTIYNFAGDVRTAISWLRQRPDIDTNAIGLLGYSEGGVVAQIVAAGDPKIAFLVEMASPGIDGRKLYNSRLVHTAAAYGEKDEYINAYVSSYQRYLNVLEMEGDPAARKKRAFAELELVFNHFGDSTNKAGQQHFIEEAYEADVRGEALSLLKYDPEPYLGKIKCPVLAINGEKDLLTDATPNLKGIEKGLIKGGNQLVTVRTFAWLNHLFQACRTCSAEEYGALDETINPAVMEFITRWVQLLY